MMAHEFQLLIRYCHSANNNSNEGDCGLYLRAVLYDDPYDLSFNGPEVLVEFQFMVVDGEGNDMIGTEYKIDSCKMQVGVMYILCTMLKLN